MKLYYLYCNYTREYAVVYAKDEYDAFIKLKNNRNIDAQYLSDWTIEIFNENSYGGILYFD